MYSNERMPAHCNQSKYLYIKIIFILFILLCISKSLAFAPDINPRCFDFNDFTDYQCANMGEKGSQSLLKIILSKLPIVIIFFLTCFLLGIGVTRYNWDANYTRKVVGFIMLTAPLLIGFNKFFQLNISLQRPLDVVTNYSVFLISLFAFSKPIRNRFYFFETSFKAIDRREDQPMTLIWLSSAYVATVLVYTFLHITLQIMSIPTNLLATVMLIIGVSDLMGGALGYRFGLHHYKINSLFSKKTYTRSIEGSFVFFVISFILNATLLKYFSLNTNIVPALFLMPIVLTLTEALSPHTWDEPLLITTGGITTLVLQKFLIF